jgi:hypothetical protein
MYITDFARNIDKSFNDKFLDSYLVNTYDFMGFLYENKKIFKPIGIIITRVNPEKNKGNHCDKYIWMFTNSNLIDFLDIKPLEITNKRILSFIAQDR